MACTACGRLSFDEVDVAPDAPAITCVNQTFDQLPAGFTTYMNDGAMELDGGRIKFSISGSVNSDIGLVSPPTSFVGRTIAIQVNPSLTESASTTIGWHEQTGDLIGVHLEMDGFNLKLNQYNPTLNEYVEHVSEPYDPTAFAWWRMREQDGDIIAEVSRDGESWRSFGKAGGRDVTMMTWDMGMGSFVTNVGPSVATMDNASDCAP